MQNSIETRGNLYTELGRLCFKLFQISLTGKISSRTSKERWAEFAGQSLQEFA